MFRDGVLVDMDTSFAYEIYIPTCCNNVVLGAPNSVQSFYGEVLIDDIISYEYTVDEGYIKDLYLSYFYWFGDSPSYFHKLLY